jgi:hypothetical protein
MSSIGRRLIASSVLSVLWPSGAIRPRERKGHAVAWAIAVIIIGLNVTLLASIL